MKKWKLSFAVFVAIVTIWCTIAVQASEFNVKSVRVADCFRPPYQLKRNCTMPAFTVQVGAKCSSVAVGDHIYSISGNLIDSEDCDGGQFICCIKIEVDPNPCIDQPDITPAGMPNGKFRVASVHCKLIAN